jgi:hypothetical protein
MTPPTPDAHAFGIALAPAAPRQSPYMPVLERPRGWRLVIPCCGILLLALFSVLYVADIALYMRILVWLTKKPFPHPFIDWEWIPSAVQCWQRGVDVYINNTCYEPLAHGRHGYSPLWLRMTFLPYGKAWLAPFGLSFAVLFFAALASIPAHRRADTFWVTFLAIFSPLTIFALERANVDLIMFLLAIAGVNCWLGTPRTRIAGYGIFIMAGLLKFYPFVLLALALRERPRVFVAVCAATVAVLLAFGLAFHDELARIGANIPTGSPFGDMFAAVNLPYGLVLLGVGSGNNPEPSVLGSVSRHLAGPFALLLTLAAIVCAVRIERRFRLAAALAAMPRREAGFLVSGALLVCACFFAGQNVGYRAIMILPTLPGLLFLSRSLPDGRVLFAATCWAIVLVMWVIPIQQVIAVLFSGNGMIVLLHWLINQLAWWLIVTALLAVLLGFMLGSEMGRLAMRRLRLG